MRTIKPGKIASKKTRKHDDRKSDQKRGNLTNLSKEYKERQIWEDFEQKGSKGKKRKEFLKVDHGRLVEKKNYNQSLNFNESSKLQSEESGDHEDVSIEARSDYDYLEDQLKYKFQNKDLLVRALTHRSALGYKERRDYERLEFLGDAVLDLGVAHLLSDRHPEAREGELSKMRAALVNTQALAEIARRLEIGSFIRLGRGEHSSGGANRPSILADVTEAIMGAMYRDAGYDTTMEKIEGIFGDDLSKVTPYDPKTELQEALHIAGSEPPKYLLEMIEGPEHAPTFVTIVVVDEEIAGRGRGATKKASQQEAAAEALRKLTPSAKIMDLAEKQNFIIETALMLSNAENNMSEDDTVDAIVISTKNKAALKES